MSHTCKALVIHCMDFRFHTAIRDWLVGGGLKDEYDLVSIAGATKGLAQEDQNTKETLMQHVALSQRLHGITKVLLLHHMDCGAYGGHAAFSSEDEEKETHVTDLKKSAEHISRAFSDLTVETFLAHISEDGTTREVTFEKI